ncbi:helix-turn-helix domain-containing protein (plasmid) [Metabacillus halosaccharovorans]|uniref:winged helix-turn-helix domain-containing protein n=1 Tax=Metabacillus halosaccharovorans TaxID=930124 RepID=UPI00203BAE2B|nr:winged helix-turn-helix domain-containing protein [Metabacillus halosaccharovorans]MCM3444135.1 winged helix-turn-helix domain-containing protein [Metabacillus halosaccharovorans]
MEILLLSDDLSLKKSLEYTLIPLSVTIKLEEISFDKNLIHSLVSKSYICIILSIPVFNTKYFQLFETITQSACSPTIIHTNGTGSHDIYSNILATICLTFPLSKTLKEIDLIAKNNEEVLIGKDIIFNESQRYIKLNNKIEFLSNIEYQLLKLLYSKRGMFVEVEVILNMLNFSSPTNLYVHIKNLREKLERNPSEPKVLINHRGFGYKIV